MPDSESITRQCRKCQVTQPIEQFPLTRGRRFFSCKSCLGAKVKKWVAANRDRSRAIKNAYVERHPETAAASRKAWYQRNREEAIRSAAARKTSDPERTRRLYREQYANDKTPFLIRAQRRKQREQAIPGAFTRQDREQLFVEQSGRCANPNSGVIITLRGAHADHKIPVLLGGSHDKANRQLLCPACNHRKGALLNEVWLIQKRELSA